MNYKMYPYQENVHIQFYDFTNHLQKRKEKNDQFVVFWWGNNVAHLLFFTYELT